MTSPPCYKYKGSNWLEYPIDQKHINLLLFITFCLLQTLAFQPPYLLFFSRLNGVWGRSRWYVDPRATQGVPAPIRSLQTDVRWILVGLPRQDRSDRSTIPIWLVCQQCCKVCALVCCMFSARYLAYHVFALTYFLVTPLGKKEKRSATMANLPKPSEVDPNNIARPIIDELSQGSSILWSIHEGAWRGEHMTQRKRRWKLVDGSYLTFQKTGRVLSPRTRRLPFFRTRISKLRQKPMWVLEHHLLLWNKLVQNMIDR